MSLVPDNLAQPDVSVNPLTYRQRRSAAGRGLPRIVRSMGSTLSYEEIKAADIASLGKDLGQVYTELVGEYSWLCLKWWEFRELYGASPAALKVPSTFPVLLNQ